MISSPIFKRMDFGLTRAGFHTYTLSPLFEKSTPNLETTG
jgi:hypothetical protein